MASLHGNGDINHPKVLAEYQEIEEALRFEREEAVSSYRQLIEPRMAKRVLLGMSIQMWSQLCGMNVMMYYVVYIMEGANIASPLLTASIQVFIPFLFLPPFARPFSEPKSSESQQSLFPPFFFRECRSY